MTWMLLVIAALVVAGLALLLLSRAARVSDSEQAEARLGPGLQTQSLDDGAMQGDRLARIRNPLLRAACRRFWSAGLNVSPAGLASVLLVWLLLAAALIFVWQLVGLVLALLPVLAVWLLIMQRERTRRRRINEQLPGFLGYLARALTAGNTLDEGLHLAAMEASEPIRGVFMSVSRQIRLGADMEDTLAEAARIYRLRALHILAMSARVNRRYGGSMRRIIATLIDTIRQQEEAGQELKSLTGETRFSAYVVAAIPIAISAFFYLQNPAYYATMLQSHGGRIAIVLALALEAAGLLIIWRMMSRLKEPDQ